MTHRIDLPPGPALLYVTSDQPPRVIEVDREPVEDDRERAFCKALAWLAIRRIEDKDREQGGRP